MFCIKSVLRNFSKFTGKHLCPRLFFNKVADLVCNFIKKESVAQVLSCEFCEISKNTFFYRAHSVVASVSLCDIMKLNFCDIKISSTFCNIKKVSLCDIRNLTFCDMKIISFATLESSVFVTLKTSLFCDIKLSVFATLKSCLLRN